MRRLLSLVAAIFLALPAAAQFYSLGSEPAGVKWYHLRTADFDVIYPKGLDSLARVYASTLERYKMPVGATAGYYPNQLYSKRLPVILHPWTANSNGMVAWTPRRMELLTTPTSVAPMNTSHFILRPLDYFVLFYLIMAAYLMVYFIKTKKIALAIVFFMLFYSHFIISVYKAVFIPKDVTLPFLYHFFFAPKF